MIIDSKGGACFVQNQDYIHEPLIIISLNLIDMIYKFFTMLIQLEFTLSLYLYSAWAN